MSSRQLAEGILSLLGSKRFLHFGRNDKRTGIVIAGPVAGQPALSGVATPAAL